MQRRATNRAPRKHRMSERIDMIGDVTPVATKWDALVDRVGPSPFVRPGWIAAWAAAWGNARLELVTVRRDGRLVAILPLRAGMGSLHSATNDHTPEYGLVAEDRDAAHALAAALFARRERLITLAPLDAARRDLAALRAASAAAGWTLLVTLVARSPYVPLDGDWDGYERRIDKKALGDMRRRCRRLEQQGRVTLDVLDGRDGLDEALEEGYRLEASGWKAARGTAIASDPHTRSFYSNVARWAAARGTLRLVFLRLDGRALAFLYGIEEGGVLYYVKGGFDPAYGDYAPGKLIVHGVLEHATAAGLSRFEFLGTDERWKRLWAARDHERVLVHAFPADVAGLVHRALLAAYLRHARPLAKRTFNRLRRR